MTAREQFLAWCENPDVAAIVYHGRRELHAIDERGFTLFRMNLPTDEMPVSADELQTVFSGRLAFEPRTTWRGDELRLRRSAKAGRACR